MSEELKIGGKGWAEKAARAHTNLTMYHAIIALAEGGCFYGYQPALTKIISEAKRAAAVELRHYDEALSVLRAGGLP